eukprot:scaffold2893_cov254-Pinguiococcus_pyrenoidosus.AAC.16
MVSSILVLAYPEALPGGLERLLLILPELHPEIDLAHALLQPHDGIQQRQVCLHEVLEARVEQLPSLGRVALEGAQVSFAPHGYRVMQSEDVVQRPKLVLRDVASLLLVNHAEDKAQHVLDVEHAEGGYDGDVLSEGDQVLRLDVDQLEQPVSKGGTLLAEHVQHVDDVDGLVTTVVPRGEDVMKRDDLSVLQRVGFHGSGDLRIHPRVERQGLLAFHVHRGNRVHVNLQRPEMNAFAETEALEARVDTSVAHGAEPLLLSEAGREGEVADRRSGLAHLSRHLKLELPTLSRVAAYLHPRGLELKPAQPSLLVTHTSLRSLQNALGEAVLPRALPQPEEDLLLDHAADVDVEALIHRLLHELPLLLQLHESRVLTRPAGHAAGNDADLLD